MLSILVIEDDVGFQETYRDLLDDLGYEADIVGSRSEAERVWKDRTYDVVLLDQRLQGNGTRDDGLDLLAEARFHGAKVILVTGYARPEVIQRAYEAGAYDYLAKNENLITLLTAKLDQIRETIRAKQRFSSGNDQIIKELWSKLREGSAKTKGRRLEELLLRVLTSVPGLVEAARNLRVPAEELDIVLRNDASTPFWAKQPTYILVEAKNWSRPVGTPEIAWFADKMRERPEARLGVFVAASGFSEPVAEQVRSYRKEGLTMVMVDEIALRRLVDSDDRQAVLLELHQAASVG